MTTPKTTNHALNREYANYYTFYVNMKTESHTPRTDDQSVRYYEDSTGVRREYVPAIFARTMEIELCQSKERCKQLASVHVEAVQRAQLYEDQRNTLMNAIRLHRQYCVPLTGEDFDNQLWDTLHDMEKQLQ